MLPSLSGSVAADYTGNITTGVRAELASFRFS